MKSIVILVACFSCEVYSSDRPLLEPPQGLEQLKSSESEIEMALREVENHEKAIEAFKKNQDRILKRYNVILNDVNLLQARARNYAFAALLEGLNTGWGNRSSEYSREADSLMAKARKKSVELQKEYQRIKPSYNIELEQAKLQRLELNLASWRKYLVEVQRGK